MESFFRRMSSIIRRHSNQSDHSETNDDNHEQQVRFRQMQRRQFSAPDVRRRTNLIDRISTEFSRRFTLFEQVNSSKLITKMNTTIPIREQYKFRGKLFYSKFSFKRNKNIIMI